MLDLADCICVRQALLGRQHDVSVVPSGGTMCTPRTEGTLFVATFDLVQAFVNNERPLGRQAGGS
jgi:hypothetical protein